MVVYHRNTKTWRFAHVDFFLLNNSVPVHKNAVIDARYICDRVIAEPNWRAIEFDTVVYQSSCHGVGQFVLLQMTHYRSDQFLHLEEVMVWATNVSQKGLIDLKIENQHV